jgi:hypothetical protein
MLGNTALDQVPSYQTADQSKYDFLEARRSAIRDLMQPSKSGSQE